MADNELVPASNLFPSRLERQANRAISHAEAKAFVARRRDALRIERIAGAASHGQSAVSYLSALEVVHVQSSQNPHTERRLRQITDVAAVGISEVVIKASR